MTTLARWNPYAEFDRMLRAFGAATGNDGSCSIERTDWAPAVDITEDDAEYLIKADLPEVSKDDVKVTVDDGTLVLHGERRQETEEKNQKFHRIERSYGSFQRRFTLPEDTDPGAVSADFKEGVLYVHLPKSEDKKPRHIEVSVG